MNGTHLPYERAQQSKGAFADQPLDLTFIGNDKGYYKMNKNQPNSLNLNTISISYRKPLEAISPVGQTRRAQLQGCSNQGRNDSTPGIAVDDEKIDGLDNCDYFNDSNLKCGKSQTLKEATFNRMRTHIYRKEKKAKWLELLDKNANSHNQNSHSHPRQPTATKLEGQRESENKTAFQRKRFVDYTYRNSRNKTNSTDSKEVQHKQRNNFEEGSFIFMEPAKQKFQLWQSPKNAYKQPTNRLSKLINAKNQRIDLHLKRQLAFVEKRKNRQLSDNIMRLKHRSPKKPQQSINFELFGQVEASNYFNINLERQDRFDAWQMGDILASKHGIVEYTDQETLTIEKAKDLNGKAKAQNLRQKKRTTFRNIKE